MIRFQCECGTQLQARDENAGKLVLCPTCQRQVTVPHTSPTAIQAAEEVELAPPQTRVQRQRPALRDEAEEEMEDRPEPAGTSGKAVASLILGILSLFCNLLAAVPALIAGMLALREIGRSRGRLSGHGLAIAGIVSAGAGTLLSCVLMLPLLLLPATQKVREAAGQAQSKNNLKQMALAMHNYNDVYGRLPPAGLGNPFQPQQNQKPLLSWRVAILPYIEQQNLYNQFKLDEPWDGPNNIKLLAKMPRTYQLPNDDKTKPDHTHYQLFVGNDAFDKTRPLTIPGDFTDGTANTILIVEAQQAVPWTKPEDVAFDPNQPIVPLLSTYFSRGCNVVLVDGSVRTLSKSISETTLKAAITHNGGEPLGNDW